MHSEDNNALISSTENKPDNGVAADVKTDTEHDQIKEKFSQVANSPHNRKLILIAIIISSIGVMYYLIFSQPDKSQKTKSTPEVTRSADELVKNARPVIQISEPLVQVQSQQPALPSLPELTVPKPPEPPPAPTPMQPPTPVFAQLNTGATPQTSKSGVVSIPNYKANSVADQEELKKKDARRKSSSLVLGGSSITQLATGAVGDKQEAATPAAKGNEGFLGFGVSNNSASALSFSPSSAAKISATYMTALDRTIAQGKMIHAVLETAINTDVIGMARAIISRDVYGESGKNILIPKGARVIGEYAKETIKDGQTRIAVNWKRLIRPDGIDIMLDSPGTDSLGRGGIEGSLDTKFWTRLSSAFLISYVVPVLANQLAKAYPDSLGTSSGSGSGANSTTTTTTTGSSGTTTTSQKSQFQQATEDFQEIAKDVAKKTFSAEPTIRIAQGERVNIFVARDLIFPTEAQLQAVRGQQ